MEFKKVNLLNILFINITITPQFEFSLSLDHLVTCLAVHGRIVTWFNEILISQSAAVPPIKMATTTEMLPTLELAEQSIPRVSKPNKYRSPEFITVDISEM